MFNSVALNVVIGLIFIYLLYSLLATIIQELISTHLGLRARTLKKGIRRMLDDDSGKEDLSDSFYDHPLMKFLGEGKLHSKPSYLGAKNFSKVFTDLLKGKNMLPTDDVNSIIQKALDSGDIQWNGKKINAETLLYLRSIWADAEGNVEKFTGMLEKWFDDTMARVTGWYKRKIQLILFLIGLSLAVVFNIDTIGLTENLSHDPKLAAQLADNASAYMETHQQLGDQLRQHAAAQAARLDAITTADTTKTSDTTQTAGTPNAAVAPAQTESDAELDSINRYVVVQSNKLVDSATVMIKSEITDVSELLGLGWKCKCKTGCQDEICIKANFHWWSIIGWLITALAISLGAPFWFDLLNKIVKMRSASKDTTDNQTSSTSK